MTSRINWKQNRKKFGYLKSKRQHKSLSEGKPMKRETLNPKTRGEDKNEI